MDDSMNNSWIDGSIFNITIDALFSTLPRLKNNKGLLYLQDNKKHNKRHKNAWWSTMGAKEPSNTQLDFLDACRRGDHQRVAGYINGKKTKRPKTPLNLFRPATPQTGWLAAIKETSTYYTPLHLAAYHEHSSICKLLCENDNQQAHSRDKKDNIPLHLAAWKGNAEIVQILIDCANESVDSVNCAQETPLHLAALHGHGAAARILLSHHANPGLRNARGENPLDIAARTGFPIVCQFLVTYSPELALQSAVDSSHTTENGRRPSTVYPLHAAARHSHIECLIVLREAGFDVDFVTSEGSALHVAAVFGQVEACKFLIEQGINPHIRDSQGRTVLQLLAEHRSQKPSDLTQIIQSRDGWADCAKLIEEYIERSDQANTNSSSDSGIDGRDGREYCRKSPEDSDAIWKPLPGMATASRDPANVHRTPSMLTNTTGYRTSSSRSSDRPSGYGTVPRQWTIDSYDPKKTGQTYSPRDFGHSHRTNTMPRKACSIRTNPHIRRGSKESYERYFSSLKGYQTTNNGWSSSEEDHIGNIASNKNNGLSASYNGLYRKPTRMTSSPKNERVNPLILKGTILPSATNPCPYQNPPPQPQRVEGNGYSITYNPIFQYDNVPTNSMVYQNTPPRQNKTWEHPCSSAGSVGRDAGVKFVRSTPRDDGTQTLPPVRRMRPGLNMSMFSPIQEVSPLQKSQDGVNNHPRIGSLRSLRDRDDSMGLGSCPRLTPAGNSRQSSMAFACSTLEKSASPVVSGALPNGRAPLALPEEMTGSTTASVMSNISPERDLRSMSLNPSETLSGSVFPADSMTDSHARSHKFSMGSISTDTVNMSMSSLSAGGVHPDSPPSPNTSQRTIFSMLINNSDVGDKLSDVGTRKGITSPTATECSDSTMASSCSLPMISQISTTPPSLASPRREWNHQYSFDDPSAPVRLRPQTRLYSEERGSELNEQEEWKKIQGIMESFGAGICRESVFASDYENKVALYLRDRRSQALTVKRSTPSDSGSGSVEQVAVERDDMAISHIRLWLVNMVGLQPIKASDVCQVLVTNGFDRIEQMPCSLTKDWMALLKLDEDTQRRIVGYLSTVEDQRKHAGNYDYLSDWLCSLELIEYLGNFMNAGFKSMLNFRSAKYEAHDYQNKLGIHLIGHIARMMNSICDAKRAEEEERSQRTETMMRALTVSEPATTPKEESYEPAAEELRLALLRGPISFSAHYLGSSEISNVNGTEESRVAMSRLKKRIREITKVQAVTMEISVNGVTIMDTNTRTVMFSHTVPHIQIVCQDRRDLNCFTYITQDSDRYYCHVFCVLTADVATDVILVLGQTFQMAYGVQQS